MTTYVIVVVNKTKLYPGIDPYIPKPAMGNMLPTTKGYDEKYQEKLDKIQMELVADPLFAYPTEVYTREYNDVSGECNDMELYKEGRLNKLAIKPLVLLSEYKLTGVNPYVDRALIMSYMAKNKMELPFWCKPEVEVFDVWKTLTGTSDWRVAMSLWGLPNDAMDATLELLKRL